MKKIYFLAIILATGSSQAQTDFEDISLSTYFDGSDLSGTDDGLGTYSSTYTEGDLNFSTIYEDGDYPYWSGGWAFSNLIDSTLADEGQTYHSYSKGAYSGDNFAVGKSGSEINVNGTASFKTIQISNTSYAAHSMTNGDLFAKQFNGDDWFELTVEGFNGTTSTGTVKVFLADSSNATTTILNTWKSVDLSSLGEVSKLTFSLNSSDVGDWGINTPSFFAMDQVMFNIITSSKNLAKQELNIYPNPATTSVNIPSGFESVKIYSITGNLIFKELNPSNTLDISSLNTGVYMVQAINRNIISTTQLIIK
jgi:hypothetical protein|tara:strand:- start:149 stop:1075 length:927 start_codon:yes stop_codon:yes gene_type:complete